MKYRLKILGTLDLRDAGGIPVNPVLQQPRRLALLIYLALAERGKMVKRDTLLGLFWPDMTQENGRRALSQAVHFLRKWLGSEAIISRGNDDIGLNSDVVECDAARFLAAARAGDLQTAAAEYGGDLLPGFFDPGSPDFEQWLDSTREQLRRRAADVFWSSAEEAKAQSQTVTAAAWARRAAALASDSESATRRLIEFLDSIDDRAGALDVYDGLVRKLQSEYETTPSQKTADLAERIRKNAVTLAVDPNATAPATSRLKTLPWREIKQRGRTLSGAAVLMIAFVSLWGLGSRDRAPSLRSDASLAIDAPEVFDAALRDEASQIVTDASAALVAVPKLKVLAQPGEFDARESAHFVLKPKFTQRDGMLRVSASLVDVETGTLVRNTSFDVQRTDAASLNAVALDMSEFARKAMGRYLRTLEVDKTSGPDAEVLSNAMLARIRSDSLLSERLTSYAVLTLERADSALVAALKNSRNPELQVSRAQIANKRAWAYFVPPLRDHAQMNRAIEEGVTAADLAIATAPDNPTAHEMRGILLHLQWTTTAPQSSGAQIIRAEAERSLRKAVHLNTDAARAWSALAQILIAKGDYAEAYWAAERGHAADIYMEVADALTTSLFVAALEVGDRKAGTRWCADISRRLQGSWNGLHCELQLIVSKDVPSAPDLARAESIVKEVSAGTTEALVPLFNSLLAVGHAKAGDASRARALLAASEAGPMANEARPYKAWAMRHLGAPNEARALLTGYVRENPSVRSGLTRSARYRGLF